MAVRAACLLVGAWCLFADQAVRLPHLLADAANLHRSLLDDVWRTHATFIRGSRERLFALDLLVRGVLGLGIPWVWAALSAPGKPVASVLMVRPGHPGRQRRALGMASVVAVLAGAALWAAGVRPRWEPALGMAMLGVVPQHVFIFGFGLALLQAHARPTEDRWAPSGHTRAAVMLTGVVFGLTHVGRVNLTEVMMSFPGGLMGAWVTWWARSVWPAVWAHVVLNAVPLGLMWLWAH